MTSINLLNLAKIGQLDAVPLSVELVTRMLASARQRLRDAELVQNSAETRFDCAYSVIRTVADIGLHLQGYRTSTSKPGHHQTAIQSLGHTLGVQDAEIRLLDGLRKQRNGADYEGEMITDTSLLECLRQARSLLEKIQTTLKAHPQLGSGAA